MIRTPGAGGSAFSPQVKVCGLTRVDEAVACAQLGAGAIGLVFYPPSPRFVDDATAREISLSLPAAVWPVGVFVDVEPSEVMKKVAYCRLKAVQLHGAEPPEMVAGLEAAGVTVIKSLFAVREPSFGRAGSYAAASAFLAEGGVGLLPGGNARTWSWDDSAGLLSARPCILAGGLDAGNIGRAIREVSPDAVDVSSGVESAPGRKSIEKVKQFLEEVFKTECLTKPRRIFQ
jgi:phosphoribosylanthranilate isomerase